MHGAPEPPRGPSHPPAGSPPPPILPPGTPPPPAPGTPVPFPGPPAHPQAGAPYYGPPAQVPQRHPALVGRELAGWWARVGAVLLDGLILLVAFLVLGGAAGLIVYGVAQVTQAGAIALGVLAVLAVYAGFLLYPPMLMKRPGPRNGQTFGRQAAGIRVVNLDGTPVTLGSAALREIVVKGLLFGAAGSVSLGVAQLLDLLWPLWDVNHQALHDKILNTAVVAER